MAVYTHISAKELEDFLSEYGLGTLKSYRGIEQGVSNTNYHVFTSRGHYILTIFEERRTAREDLPFLFAYAGHLASKGIACPQVVLDKDGRAIKDLREKPAALVSFLEGEDIPRGFTTEDQCGQMGKFLARMHEAVIDFPLHRDIHWSRKMFRDKAEEMRPELVKNRPDLVDLIFNELDFLDVHYPGKEFTERAVHLDLFPDNVFFWDGKISAIIDMYFACTEALVYDLAIVVNSWCFDGQNVFRPKKFKALMAAYETVRKLPQVERKNFQAVMRAASMRFLISRMEELFAFQPGQTLMVPHNPQEFIDRLKFHQQHDILNG